MADEEQGRTVAALCYIPLFLINIIAIIYALLVKKDDRYARFHAIQGLAILLVMMVVNIIIQIPVMLIWSIHMSDFFSQPTEFFSNFFVIWQRMFLLMIPMTIVYVVYLLVSIYFAYMALQGKRFRIPLITRAIEGFV